MRNLTQIIRWNHRTKVYARLVCSDGVLPHVDERVVGSQWSDVEAGAARLSSRLHHGQSGRGGPGAGLDHAVDGGVARGPEPQLLHAGGLLCGEGGAPPGGGQGGVHQLPHLLPGPQRFVRLAGAPRPRGVVMATRQLLQAADGGRSGIRGHDWNRKHSNCVDNGTVQIFIITMWRNLCRWSKMLKGSNTLYR